ncbi:MAG: DUF5060 domain-containing protein [Parafilimonas sp.]
MKKIQLLCFAFVLCTMQLNAQKPVFNSVTTNATSIAKYDKFELTIDLTAGYTNPYNYDDIATQCIFTSPSAKKDTVDGFYIENYSLNTTTGALTDLGTHNFKVRFSPAETGTWSYVLSAKNTSGITTQSASTFQCIASSIHGFIKKNNTNYLNFDDGTQYIPVGENMGWQDNNVVTDYTNWLGKLSSNGGNFIRVWMSDWAFALEWKNGNNGFAGLEQYKQTSAYYLDWLLDKCSSLNVYMQLCLNHHGQVSTQVNPEWSDNPYNAANGGPCANTWDFFSNTTAKSYYQNRQRYIIARYGYSKNIESWELFNEVDLTDDFDAHQTDITSWHDQFSTYIKFKDVYKHLVTTSYANSNNDADTWKLPNIDFTQTHNYISSPNIETILASDNKNYLSAYNKPTLNGEFGLGGAGDVLSTEDPNGVHIHNAIWATSVSGALGSAMTWWWDDYVDPQNLYYHYKPLSSFISNIKLKDDNYKSVTATISGGERSDLIVSPAENFEKASASDFTIDANGNMTPDASNLSQYLFGSTYNTQYRNPPTFHVTYAVNGEFKVITAGSVSGSSPHVSIYVDNVLVLDQSATINTTYSVNISAGAHDIKVDNLGIDWAQISNYTFTNIAPPLEDYVLGSADKNRLAGWALNKKYNWQYLHDSAKAPLPVTGTSVIISGVNNGAYTVNLYSCSTGLVTSTLNANATNGTLTIPLPSVAWDVAFTAINQSVLAVDISKFYGEQKNNQNVLHINIAQSENVKIVMLERSSDGVHFSVLNNVSTQWTLINGAHIYTDMQPLQGNNFYRLSVTDNDGKQTTSNVVLLVNDNNKININFYPNPFKNYVMMHADAGKYVVTVTDIKGKNIFNNTINANSDDIKISLPNLAAGIYYIAVKDANGNVIQKEKIVKQ